MTDSDGQRNHSLRTLLLVLGMLVLASTVAYMQVSEHRAPRATFAGEQSPIALSPQNEPNETLPY